MMNDLPYFDERGFIRNTHHFSKAGQHRMKYGRYCEFPIKSKDWLKFWEEEKRRCLEGIKIGEVYITGYHYFYLNYYPMEIVTKLQDGTTDKILGHPRFWFLDWQFFTILDYCQKHGLHLAVVKTRGCGYSEKLAACGARDTNIVARDDNDNKIFRKTFYFATLSEHLGGEGIFYKCSQAIDFLNNETDGFFKKSFMLADSPADYLREAGVIKTIEGNGVKERRKIKTGGLIQGVILGNNLKSPDKIRGKRGNLVVFEEAGTIKHLVKCINTARPLVEIAGDVVGTIVVFGTSNVDANDVEGLKNVIYNPNGFRCVKFRNVWQPEDGIVTEDLLNKIPSNPLDFIIPFDSEEYYEKGSGVGWFVPVYDVRKMDEDGNPLRIESFREINKQRNAILTGQSNDDAMSYFADNPYTIEEALIKSSGKEFQSPKLSKQIVDIESGLITVEPERGYMIEEKDENGKMKSVYFKKDDKGNVLILQHPSWIKEERGYLVKKAEDNEISKLYIAGIDSVDQNKKDSSSDENDLSKIACVIKKRIDPTNPLDYFNGCYVAMYLYRSDDSRKDYEQIALLHVYYNAIGLLEHTRVRIRDYFVEKNLTRHLAREPNHLSGVIKNYTAISHKIGVRATSDIIKAYIEYIKEYIEDYSDKIFFKSMLKQLNEYVFENKKKYDLIAAMGMCELLDRELRNSQPKVIQSKNQIRQMTWFTDYSGRKVFGYKSNDF